MQTQEYPAPREVVSFKDWLALKYSEHPEAQMTDRQSELLRDHIETRATYAEYTVNTWEDPEGLLTSSFTLERIGAVMQREHHVYVNMRLPSALRMRAWAALTTLFRELFDRHCSTSLRSLSSMRSPTKGLDTACYMWWEYSPYYPEMKGAAAEDHEQFFAFCANCLAMANPAVQESALHGLGHAQKHKPTGKQVESIIDAFLSGGADVRPDVVRYARSARQGRVQ